MDYDYEKGKERIEKILNNNTEIEEKDELPESIQLNFDNGYYSCITSIFVDIRKSTELIENNEKIIVSKVLRSFTSEIIEILREGDYCRQIGIQGDCVFAIYTTPNNDSRCEVADKTFYVNTFMNMLNNLLIKYEYPTIEVGVGISYSKELVVKAGRKGVNIYDNIWIGESTVTASNLSNEGNKNGVRSVVFSDTIYQDVKNYMVNTTEDAKSPEDIFSYHDGFYSASLIFVEFNNWIKNGMLK